MNKTMATVTYLVIMYTPTGFNDSVDPKIAENFTCSTQSATIAYNPSMTIQVFYVLMFIFLETIGNFLLLPVMKNLEWTLKSGQSQINC